MEKKKKKLVGKRSLFSDTEKRKLIRGFKAHRGPKAEFFRAQGVTASAVYRWVKEATDESAGKKPASKSLGGDAQKVRSANSPARRKEAVEAYLKSGRTFGEFAKIWGVSSKSLGKWCKIYEERGAAALESGIYGTGKRGRKGSSPHVKAQIVAVQSENPSFGLKKVRDFLYRFRGVKVSTGTVRKTVKEAKLPRAPLPPKKRRKAKDKIRRFERSKPMQMWQSDITSFVLTRHSQRVYLTVFIDDHSRYIVSWSLLLRQKSDLVMDSLLLGIQRFGKPEEVLTDQGRQYFSWRGKSDFQKLLDREGIKHVVARSHHPQTLGKCERFWETVGQEFWERVKPQELEDTRTRFGHFIAHYNHFRPHQGIDGMTPADRFFGVASEVKRAIEETLTQNELRLAVGDAPRSPVFLIGQIGDQPVSLHGESGSLVIQTPNGAIQHLDYSQFGHKSLTPPASQLPIVPQAITLKGLQDHVESNTSAASTAIGIERGPAAGQGEGADGSPQPASPQNEKSAQTPGENAECAANRDEEFVGVGKRCPEGASPQDGGVPDGVLAGSVEQARDRATVESTARASLAALQTSNLRYGSGTAHATKSAGASELAAHGPSERSQDFADQDHSTRAPDGDANPPDPVVARSAGLESTDRAWGLTRELSTDASERSAARPEECKTSQEGKIASPESNLESIQKPENPDDGTSGRQP